MVAADDLYIDYICWRTVYHPPCSLYIQLTHCSRASTHCVELMVTFSIVD